MKIATFNIQNIFHRHIDLINDNYEQKITEWTRELDSLFKKGEKTETDFLRMRELTGHIDFNGLRSFKTNISRQLELESYKNREDTHLYFQYSKFVNEESKWHTVPIPFGALYNKLKVVGKCDADILILQEVESRYALLKMNEMLYQNSLESSYKDIIHLDGNNKCGLGMGIMVKNGFRIKTIKSHSSERDVDGSLLFQNDLQVYKVETPKGEMIHILCVHIDSSLQDKANASKRARQASMVSKVYNELRSVGNETIVILGTLNAPIFSKCLAPITDMDVTDIADYTNFDVEPDFGTDSGYYRLGGFRKGVNMEQLDYLLASPQIGERIQNCGMDRKAIWPIRQPQWDIYKTLKKEQDAASEHPLLWVNIEMNPDALELKNSA
ncbi:hypothetical protein [Maribacter sp. 2307UL18-2]|uniref:hypothetical protein n=1 Tax=Maribacter sp. 2307UL18-2 TaxID=3386274 RepID=UPI0039BD85E7